MRGQYEVVNEVFLFMLGILIVTTLAASLETVRASLQSLNMKRNYEQVGAAVGSFFLHSFLAGENTTIALGLPPLIGDEPYRLVCDDNSLRIEELNNPENNVTYALFNISSEKTLACDELSSGIFFRIRNSGNVISLTRW